MKNKTVQIGVVGVDSGQLMLCDPCYIDSQWERDEQQVTPPNVWQDKETGRRYALKMHHDPNVCAAMKVDVTFKTWEEPLDDYDGATPNEVREREWEKVEVPRHLSKAGQFSYPGVCHTTIGEERAGQLDYKLGHEGVAVAFSSGYGDGVYPVFAEYDDEGRIIRVSVEMG